MSTLDRRVLMGVVALTSAGAPSFAQPASLSLPAGGTSHIQVAGSTTLALQQFTAAAWIRPTGPGISGGGTVMTCGQRAGAPQFACSWWFGWTASTGQLSAMVVNQYGVAGRVVNSNGTVPLNLWKHVAMTFDGTAVRVYINGQLDAQAAYGFTGIDYPPLPSMNIGRFLDTTATYNHLDGQIDDVTLWSRALDATELAALVQCEPAPNSPGLAMYLPFTSDSLVDRSPAARVVTPVASPAFDVNAAPVGMRPLITEGPAPARMCPGGTVTLSFTGTGTAPFGYRWRKGGVLIDTVANPSAATAVLTLTNVQSTDTALYDCVVTSTCGNITSSAAMLTVSCPNKADVAGLGGSPGCDGQNTVDDIVFYLAQFFAGNVAVADIVALGGGGTPDGAITPDDLIAFLGAFFAACP